MSLARDILADQAPDAPETLWAGAVGSYEHAPNQGQSGFPDCVQVPAGTVSVHRRQRGATTTVGTLVRIGPDVSHVGIYCGSLTRWPKPV